MADRRRNVAFAGAILIATLGVLTFLQPNHPVRPWPVVQVGGTRLAWHDSLRREWEDVAACVGLQAPVDTSVVLWQLPADAPRISRDGISLDYWEGWYFDGLHAVVLTAPADTARARTILRHELLHSLLRSPHDTHEPVFAQYATECNLGQVTP